MEDGDGDDCSPLFVLTSLHPSFVITAATSLLLLFFTSSWELNVNAVFNDSIAATAASSSDTNTSCVFPIVRSFTISTDAALDSPIRSS